MSQKSESWEDLLRERVRALSEERAGFPEGRDSPDLAEGNAGETSAAIVEARRFLDFALKRKEPSIPSGARFDRIKRAILRAARIFTRPQAEFNAAVVEVLERNLRELAALRDEAAGGLRKVNQLERNEAASAAGLQALAESIGLLGGEFRENLQRVESALEQEQRARDEVSRALRSLAARFEKAGRDPEDLHREIERLRSLQALDRNRIEEISRTLESGISRAPREPILSGAGQPRSPVSLPDTAYFDFENRFRGSEAEIRTRQEIYIPFFRDLAAVREKRGPVLDAGCGRGEFLELLKREGIDALGVDSNRAMVARAVEKGLRVEAGDLFENLRARADRSLGGFFAAQVVEHLPVDSLAELLNLVRKKTRNGGGIVLETINPESVYAMKFFWNDPTHVRPVPASTLEMLARAAGFSETEIRFLSPVDPAIRLAPGADENLLRLDRTIFGEQDYALFARVMVDE